MYDYKQRKSYFHVNKYQREIIKLALLPVFAFCILLTAFCVRFRYETEDMMRYGTRFLTLSIIDQWLTVILAAIWLFFIFVIFRSIRISNHLVGSFERINHDLEKTIRGEMRQALKTREDDELARNLLQRINVLIDNLPEGPLRVR